MREPLLRVMVARLPDADEARQPRLELGVVAPQRVRVPPRDVAEFAVGDGRVCAVPQLAPTLEDRGLAEERALAQEPQAFTVD